MRDMFKKRVLTSYVEMRNICVKFHKKVCDLGYVHEYDWEYLGIRNGWKETIIINSW